jgi:superfamily II DNA or RNA helicase
VNRSSGPVDATPAWPVDDVEARAVLLSFAGRRLRPPLAALLVEHVLAVTIGAGWPVRRAALEAVLRRSSFAARDGLRVAVCPPRGTAFGVYTTRRPGAQPRPYATLLESALPLRASCDCADFLRSSLGLCKHVLVVLEHLVTHAVRLQRSGRRDGRRRTRDAAPERPRLEWDPIRPLTGLGDWLERVRLTGGDVGAVGRWFAARRAGARLLADVYTSDPERRLQLVDALLAAVGASGRGAVVAEPAVRALLREERERCRAASTGLDDRAFRTALRSLRRKLYPYQIAGVARAVATGRLLLADDMGLGKTAQAIAVCHVLRRAGQVTRGLVIAPASLKPQWLREWQLFTAEPIEVVEGRADERRRFYRRERTGFLIANYEQVIRDLEWIDAWGADIVVLDEAQRIKNWATKTAATVKRLRPRFRLVLTGTPMENRLEELASIFDWIDDLALEPKWRLVPFHAVYADGKTEVSGARNLDTLRLRLEPRMLRRRRAEILRDLPPRTDTTVPVELTEAQRSEHDALLQPIARLAAIARSRPLTQAEFLRLMSLLTTQRIVANGIALLDFTKVWPAISSVARPDEALLRSLCSPKLLELREIVRQIAVEQARKIVVFSQWVRMLRLAHWAVVDTLGDAGFRAVFFTGEEGAKRRTQNLVEFHDEPAVRVLFASDAGGVGLNLQRAASSCVNLELPWNPAVLEQRVGRIYRLGQKRPIDVYNLITAGSIEERIAGLVSEKRALFSGLFDGTSDEVRFERSGGFLARLERLVEVSGATVHAAAPVEEEPEEEARADEEIDDLVQSAVEAGGMTSAPAGSAEPTSAHPVDVRELFAGVRVLRREDGGLVIEARQEAARTLLGLFEGMAELLRQATR